MKKLSKKKLILFAIILLFVAIQFIRPEKNNGYIYGKNDFTKSLNTPPEIKSILEASCFDCHSNKTNSVWYENIQPVAWWMAHHVEEGKEELNFSEFHSYKPKRKIHKLDEVIEQIEKDEMPPTYYKLMHTNSKLDDDKKKKIIDWARESISELKSKYDK